VLLSEYGQAARPDIHTIFMPLQPVAAANILNGREGDTGYHEIKSPGVRFTAPGARSLSVDDIETNLSVAKGLLSPYQTSIDCAGGGPEAIQLARQNHYDLIFMDHMMPGMDGIEAATAIRAWEEEQRRKKSLEFPKETPEVFPKGIPIIALTANAVSGMKEMFLEKGFSDYISKPIEIARLDEIISRWIPPEKRIKDGTGIKRETFKGAAGISIPGVDVKQGIAMTGGTEAGYRKVLAQFRKDAAERLSVFSAIPSETTFAVFATQAHAIKSAAGTIGAAEVSTEAAALEAAGKAGDMGLIREALPGFREHLAELVEGIGEVLEERSEKAKAGSGKQEDLAASLSALRAALEAKNMKEIDRLLETIETAAVDARMRETINAVSDKVLMGEYEGAIAVINEIDRVTGGGA
jgi:CheY-like chemotaxis protein